MSASENLPPYSGGGQCPKCGCAVDTTWHECGQPDASLPCHRGGVHRGEHLCRQCPRCKYGWVEATKDATGEPRRLRPAR